MDIISAYRQLSNKEQSELKRAKTVSDLDQLLGFHRLGRFIDGSPDQRAAIIFVLPWIKPGSLKLVKLLSQFDYGRLKHIFGRKRCRSDLAVVLRSEFRRLNRPECDIDDLCNTLKFWCKEKQREIYCQILAELV